MNKLKFIHAINKIINKQRSKNGIGTLGEKTLHAVLKNYFEPSEANHEIKIGSFVADIVNESGIIEIQTRAFDKLRKKLSDFLQTDTVTVVYPIAKTKWLIWVDENMSELSKKRKSPKQGKIYDIFEELYKIKQLLDTPNLKLCIVLIDIEEYRYLNGWSKDKKRGSSRCDRVPVDIADEIYISSIHDYIKLIPDELEQQFTSKDYKKATGLNMYKSQIALNVLNYVNAVKRVGKRGNLYVYERIK